MEHTLPLRLLRAIPRESATGFLAGSPSGSPAGASPSCLLCFGSKPSELSRRRAGETKRHSKLPEVFANESDYKPALKRMTTSCCRRSRGLQKSKITRSEPFRTCKPPHSRLNESSSPLPLQYALSSGLVPLLGYCNGSCR